MPKFTDAAEFAKAITAKFRQHRRLFERMDSDHRLWRMEKFVPDAAEGIGTEDSYTTNTHRTLAEKISAFISNAPVIIRVPNFGGEAERAANNAAEQLAIGMLREADERLMTVHGQPPFQAQMAWFTTVRGGYAAARFMLVKDEGGRTLVDITPIDPRQFVFQTGRYGLAWAATRVFWDRVRVKEEFPGFKFGDEETKLAAREDPSEEVEEVLECYYAEEGRYYGGVIIDDRWARKPEELFTPRFPIIVVPVGDVPLVAPGDMTPAGRADTPPIETVDDIGESVFAANRNVIDAKNRLLTYRMKLTAMGVKRTWLIYSAGGTKDLDENPNEGSGQSIKLDVASGEKIELAEIAQLTRDADVLLERLTDDETDGGLPPQAFGILPAPISSLALKQLGNNLEHKVTPRARAIQVLLETGFEALLVQYESGQYEPIRVRGRTYRRQAFNRIVMPEELQGRGRAEVRLTPVYPEEEIANWNIAKIATSPTGNGAPLASNQWAQDNILHMEDRDQVLSENMLTMAQLSDPMARALQMLKAAVAEGDEGLTKIWFDELNRLNIMKQVQTIQAQMLLAQGIAMGGQPGQNGSQPGEPGMRPEVSPAAGQPGFTPQPSPEAGANTTAPRNNSNRAVLNAIGLEPPQGA